ncbi:MAG: tRNA (adenosine(37)-N6)-dimethylallyltransferase MiaA [Lachnospiraceae bacterium]|nr:tRNA (adenosine(37)-N6)-dimethylallyltransferase MiaA [Lachnospiraceae bacterium]
MNNPLIILTGPTAAGKTKLSIELAKTINGEIISADSMQVYKHMNIGSAKIRPEEMQGVKHYLVDILEPTEDFNIVLFQKYAKQAITEIYEKGKIPIIVGGTGFYIQSVLYDIDFQESDEDTALRTELEQLARDKGVEYLHNMLKACDPKAAQAIHANNVKRVIRAIEFYRQTGSKISEHNETEREKKSAYNSCYFVLTDKRERLYEKIDQRVDRMMEAGLVNEVKQLMDMGCKRDSTAMQGLGYKEIISYLAGEITLEEAVYIIKRDTRHFAKRQLTWFRRERNVIWINKDKFAYDDEKMLNYINSFLRKNQP